MNELIPVVVTHEGRHHADEILSCWFLRELLGGIRIVRTSDPELWRHADILLDCGGRYDPANQRFDHHGACVLPAPPKGRVAGYATAGLLWRLYGPAICESVMAASYEGPWHEFVSVSSPEELQLCYRFITHRLDQELVAPIDAWDLGLHPPRELGRLALPFQWLLPHLPFEVAMDALGKAFTQRLRMLAETVAEEKLLEDNLRLNGPCQFYVFQDWLVIRAPGTKRLELKAAKQFAGKVVKIPLLAALSTLRNGKRWGAFFLYPIPDSYPIPNDLEYAAGRRTFFHDDPDRLLDFVRSCAEANLLPIPNLRVSSGHE